MAGSNIYRELTPRLALVSFIGSLGALNFGFDIGWWGCILGAPYFNQQYGSATVTNATTGATSKTLSASEQSAGTGIGTAGIMLGIMFAPWFNEKYGRKRSFLLLAVVGIIGTVVQAASTVGRKYWVLVTGKLILNFSIGIASAVVGVYLSECSPATVRGTLLSNYNVVQNIGYLISSGCVYGVVLKMAPINWLLPICMQAVLPVVIIICSPLIPESPRWLIAQGRTEEATEVIRMLRKQGTEEYEIAVVLEVAEIKAAYEEIKILHDGVGWVELFRGANLRRTLVAIGLQCLQQAQGVSFVSNYILITMIGLGIHNPYAIIVAIYSVLLVTSLGAFYLPDRIGRRPLLLVGSASGAIWMAVFGTISAVATVPTGNLANFLVASLFLYIAFFSNTWSVMPWTVSAEISAAPLREMTLAIGAWSGFGVGLIVVFVSPYLQHAEYAGLGGKIAFVWMGFSIISGIWVFFMVPELKNRSLEELDYMFEARVPIRKFKSFDTTELLAQKKREHGTDRVASVIIDEKTDLEPTSEPVKRLEYV
ncbi:hypothetical protein IAR55_006734 [Kwoniella newhampshirensis]|uniref:Major facilitator superfamily (MFS) profile domain-containing protein n=1 Tax=Kwoniella newhampshirensis TaxID=1651941 RepID=A0AAW0YWG9_9TREE